MHQRSRAASLHLPLLSGQGWYEAGPAVHDPSLIPAQLPKPPSPFCTRTPSLPELHGGCEHVNLTFSRCLGPQLDSPCRKIRGGGKSYCLLPLTKERRTFTYRCKPWAQHKQICICLWVWERLLKCNACWAPHSHHSLTYRKAEKKGKDRKETTCHLYFR